VIETEGARLAGEVSDGAFRPFVAPACHEEPATLATSRASWRVRNDAVQADETDLAIPAVPRILFCTDDNYGDQRRPRRAGLALRRPDALRPFLTGAPIESVLITAADPLALRPSGAHVLRPFDCDRLDVGVSLAAIVGDAQQPRVVGYAVALDFMRLDVPQNQAYLARSFPTHKVVSQTLVTADDFGSALSLELTLRIDGEIFQRSSTSELIAGPDELVTVIARRCELHPGDLVLTGSPYGRPVDRGGPWVKPGSLVEGHIDRIGTVRAQIAQEAAPF
jgi:2-keto-4-pentenoate hydratase/2-oxohepta-3-ene-1,7-dioic acid hydratase in catechol pathway